MHRIVQHVYAVFFWVGISKGSGAGVPVAGREV